MGTTDMLEDLGHNVITTHSGAQAIGILKEDHGIDLVVTDFSMPKMNGAQLAELVREFRPDLPILLATGYAELPQGTSVDIPRIGKSYQKAQMAEEIAKLLRSKSEI